MPVEQEGTQNSCKERLLKMKTKLIKFSKPTLKKSFGCDSKKLSESPFPSQQIMYLSSSFSFKKTKNTVKGHTKQQISISHGTMSELNVPTSGKFLAALGHDDRAA